MQNGREFQYCEFLEFLGRRGSTHELLGSRELFLLGPDTCATTQELPRPWKFMGRSKNLQSDCMQNDKESQYRIQWSLSTSRE